MRNDRPLDNPRIQNGLDVFHYLCIEQDLAGGIYLLDDKEMGFSYHMDATWNAFVMDAELPSGFRIRVKQDELGRERAKEFLEGAAFVIGMMQQFGYQTRLWGKDLQKLVEKSGMKIHHNYPKVEHLYGVDMRKKRN